jgi:N-acetyl-anhydromuramyl-L-alanine amidase AmpD
MRLLARKVRRWLAGRTGRAASALFAGAGLAALAVFLTGASRAARPARAADPPGPAQGWKYIVIHHSATPSGNAEIFGNYHVKVHGWHSLGYHFVIGNGNGSPDGSVEIGERWLKQQAGAHAGNPEYNARGVGICLVGDFEKTSPTPCQMEAVAGLCAELCEKHGIAPERIVGHRDVRRGGDTLCPGRNFPMADLRDMVAKRLGRPPAADRANAGPVE